MTPQRWNGPEVVSHQRMMPETPSTSRDVASSPIGKRKRRPTLVSHMQIPLEQWDYHTEAGAGT
jgi:hypothetical protein